MTATPIYSPIFRDNISNKTQDQEQKEVLPPEVALGAAGFFLTLIGISAYLYKNFNPSEDFRESLF